MFHVKRGGLVECSVVVRCFTWNYSVNVKRPFHCSAVFHVEHGAGWLSCGGWFFEKLFFSLSLLRSWCFTWNIVFES